MYQNRRFSILILLVFFLANCVRTGEIPVEDIRLAQDHISINQGEALNLEVAEGSNISSQGVIWESSALEVADIQEGKLIAKSPGSAEISVSSKENPEIKDIVTIQVLPVDKLEFIDAVIYDFGDPGPEETYMLQLINRARSDPKQEASSLLTTDSQVELAVKSFSESNNSSLAEAKSAIKNAFGNFEPLPPLAFSQQLNLSAKRMANLIRDHGIQDHNIAGSTIESRINDTGYAWSRIGENIFAYGKSVQYAHAALNIDWGDGPNGIQDPPGHRLNIMEDKGYLEIGIHVIPAIPESESTGPVIVTQNFALPLDDSGRFLTGVVFEDKNGNSFFDPGEGVPDVVLYLPGGIYYSVSSIGGAYVIPFETNTGSITVQATGKNITAQSKEIYLGTENIQLNFPLKKAEIQP